ncbi:16S rRNA (cytidine(1402)-2'-O)-methyltransferase [Candidatus Gracilibacteria bacterium]|nr:16S rRNA (cytidine(1402)-2'-O)-methyltransferase [Candidatus Gracilibacteria bacterium]
MSELFIVATPIGNLEDISFRAVKTLKEVDFIICEDTRHTKILLNRYDIQTKSLVSFHAQSSETKAMEISKRIKNGKTAALISDAGTPGISDPGFKLIKFCVEKGIKLIPIPGVSAFLTLISVSGFPIDKFYFGGFLPHKKGRQTILKNLAESEVSQVFYESVHRFSKLLGELENFVGGDRKICVGRELTKLHEEIFRGTVKQAQAHFKKENTRGEFVVLVGPKSF